MEDQRQQSDCQESQRQLENAEEVEDQQQQQRDCQELVYCLPGLRAELVASQAAACHVAVHGEELQRQLENAEEVEDQRQQSDRQELQRPLENAEEVEDQQQQSDPWELVNWPFWIAYRIRGC